MPRVCDAARVRCRACDVARVREPSTPVPFRMRVFSPHPSGDRELRALFATYGEVLDVYILASKVSQEGQRGCGARARRRALPRAPRPLTRCYAHTSAVVASRFGGGRPQRS